MACEDAWHDQGQAMKSKAKAIRKRSVFPPIGVGIVVAFCCLAQPSFSSTQAQPQSEPPKSRRSQRVHMQEVQVASPDGKLKFTILPNAERLTFTVTFGNATVIEPSPIVMKLDGYDLSSGVVFDNAERYELNDTYPWYGAHSTAVNQCNGVKISLTDRKSTRLNSSHITISYAVFCLKKKKKK